jgi:hypothetical protein
MGKIKAMNIDSNNIPDNIKRLMAPSDKPKGNAGITFDQAQEKRDQREEREIQRDIATDLDRRGIPYCRPRIDRKSTIRIGWPDFTLSYCGRFVGLEVKTATGRLSPEQQDCLFAIRAAPSCGIAVTVRSLADVVELLRILEDSYSPPVGPMPERFTRLDQ